jgi:hypothetical protein
MSINGGPHKHFDLCGRDEKFFMDHVVRLYNESGVELPGQQTKAPAKKEPVKELEQAPVQDETLPAPKKKAAPAKTKKKTEEEPAPEAKENKEKRTRWYVPRGRQGLGGQVGGPGRHHHSALHLARAVHVGRAGLHVHPRAGVPHHRLPPASYRHRRTIHDRRGTK